MRCPNCGADSASSSPRCAHCDALLVPPVAGDATAQDNTAGAGDTSAEDQTTRDPFGSSPEDAPPGGVTPDAADATTHDQTYRAPYGAGPMGGNPPDAGDATTQGHTYRAPYGGGPPSPPSGSPAGGVPVPWDPVPPPWADQSPVQWEARPDHTLNMPPAEERTTHLAPEPWSEPWSEPAIWQPPAPPKRSMLPYFLGAAGVVLLIGVALGIVFWPSGSGSSPPAASEPSPGQSRSVASASDSPASGGDLDAQAGAVNDLLEDMGGTRSDLGTVVTQGCPVSGVRRVLDARRGQLENARGLDVSALDNGAEMKAALVRALEASTESNQRYLDGAPGCPSDGEVADVNQRASSAKSEFIGYWNPVAQQAGLPARTEGDI